MSTVGLAGPLTDSISAGSTQTQGGATAITTEVARVTVSGTDGDGVKLPTAVAGQKILIINDDAAQTIKIWPNTSDAIDGGSADAVDANVLGPGSSREYVASDATNWYTASPIISQAAATLLDDATVAAMATTLGLGTGDTPTFTGINLGDENLDHYDEGSFTPVVRGDGNAGVHSYGSQIGRYVRIGNLVVCMWSVSITTVGTAGNAMTGTSQIGGLPFTASNVAISFPGFLRHISGADWTASMTMMACEVIGNSTVGYFRGSGDNAANDNITSGGWADGDSASGTIIYTIGL
jgi:hypothetical protein